MSASWIHCNHCYSTPGTSATTNKKYFLSSCGHLFCEHCNVSNESDLKCSICKKSPYTSHCINRTLSRNLQNLFRPPLSLYDSLFKKVKSVIAFRTSQAQVERKQMEDIMKQHRELMKKQASLKEENECLKRKMAQIFASGTGFIALVENLERNCSQLTCQIRRLVAWSECTGSKTSSCVESTNIHDSSFDCANKGFCRKRCSSENECIDNISNDASTSTADQLLLSVGDTIQKDKSSKNIISSSYESKNLNKCSPSVSFLSGNDLLTPVALTGGECQGTSATNGRKSNPYITELWSRKSSSLRGVFKGRMSSPLSGATWPRLTLGVSHKDYSSGSVRLSKSLRKIGENRSLLDYTVKPMTSLKYQSGNTTNDK